MKKNIILLFDLMVMASVSIAQKNMDEIRLTSPYLEYYNTGMQHAYMADHYIDILGEALWEFDGKLFSLDYYKALSWQGLDETIAYINKSQTEKNAILTKQQELLAGRNRTNCNDNEN